MDRCPWSVGLSVAANRRERRRTPQARRRGLQRHAPLPPGCVRCVPPARGPRRARCGGHLARGRCIAARSAAIPVGTRLGRGPAGSAVGADEAHHLALHLHLIGVVEPGLEGRLAASSAIAPPLRRRRFSVASWFSTSATTMSPFSALVCGAPPRCRRHGCRLRSWSPRAPGARSARRWRRPSWGHAERMRAVLQRLDRRAGRDPPDERHRGRVPVPARAGGACRTRAARARLLRLPPGAGPRSPRDGNCRARGADRPHSRAASGFRSPARDARAAG